MSNILWGIKYAVYPFDFIKADGTKLLGKIIVYDKGGSIVKLGDQEWQFKNFTKAMVFVNTNLVPLIEKEN